jgi:hypothetical protein
MKFGRVVGGFAVIGAIVYLASGTGRPSTEQRFVAAVSQAHNNYNQGANDMAKGATRPARAQLMSATC